MKNHIDEKIMEFLDEDAANEEYLLEKLNNLKITKTESGKIFPALLRVFTSMDFCEEEAESIWKEIIEYKKGLSVLLSREVSFRVAMLDYFININKKMINPKLIEIRLFAETEKLILIDELTRLYNRRHFQSSIQREFKQATRYSQPLSVMIMDIDNFKKINDTYGHLKGDEILVEVGKTINACMRSEDTACRIGGEEFAIILPHTSEANSLIAAQKLIDLIRTIPISDSKFVTVSGGIATYPEKATSVNELYDFADKALYYAKYSGKNRIIAYSQDKRGSLRINANLELLCLLPDKTIKTISNNISITGIAFETEENVALSDIFDVKLNDDLSGNQIEATIRIVRKEPSENNSFRVGAEFTTLKQISKEKLGELFRRKS